MIRLLALLLAAVAVGYGAFQVGTHRAFPSPAETPTGTDRELAWLTAEFQLTPAQAAQVEALHAAYRPVCADQCSRYAAAHRRLEQALQAPRWSDEAGRLIREEAGIQGECHASMLVYAYRVAGCMAPAQGARYLRMIKLELAHGDPAGMFAAAR